MTVTPAAPLRTPPPVSGHDNLKGVAIMALGFFLFAGADAMAKLLTQHVPPVQVVWFRQTGLFLGVLVLLALRGSAVMRSTHPVLQLGRGVTAALSATLFILALQYVPLADATAVTFIAPFIVTVLGALILRESVGWRRWAAVAVGFVGMLIVTRPGMGVFHPAIFFAVAAASSFALRQILSRYLSGGDSIATTVAYTSIVSFVLATLALPFFWVTPQGWQPYALAAGVSLLAGLGEIAVIRALTLAQAVVLAPVHYSIILWATFYGFFVFGQLPDGWTLLGCAIIVASGLYTLNRERAALRR